MVKIPPTSFAQLAKTYATEKLRLDPRAGTAIGDEFWISLAGYLMRRNQSVQSESHNFHMAE